MTPLWPASALRRQQLRLFAVHAFLDETGDFRGSRLSYFAGFFADNDRWNAFNPEWAALLKRHHIKSLHVTDFLSAKSREYAHLNLTDPQKVDILGEFATIALQHAIWGFAIAIDAKAYQEALPGAARAMKADEFVFTRALRHLHNSAAEQGMPEVPLECVFDERDDSTRFYAVWKRLKKRREIERRYFASITFADDSFVLPLQAADLLCASARRPDNNGGLGALFQAPDHPVFGKRILNEVWTREKFESEESLIQYRV